MLPQNAISYFYSGLCAESEGNFKLKDEYFRIALKNNPDLSGAVDKLNLWQRPNFYKYPGYIEIIERGYVNGIRLDSTYSLFKNNLAYLYASEGFNLDRGLKLINLSLKLDPNNYASLDTKSWIQYQLGRYKEAHQTFLQAQSLTPEGEYDIIYYYHLGKIKLALGDSLKAEECFNTIFSVPEPDAEGMRYRGEISEILKELK